jgi:hypothetical protein
MCTSLNINVGYEYAIIYFFNKSRLSGFEPETSISDTISIILLNNKSGSQ